MNSIDYQADLSSIDSYAQQQISTQQFAGISWSVDLNGTVLCAGQKGFSDHALSKPLSPGTIYRIYSMTKPVVSVLCVMLLEQGRLQLDDPVSSWIPALAGQSVSVGSGLFEPVNRPITIGDLLTHRAGFSYDFLPACEIADRYRAHSLAEDGSRSLDELVALLCSEPLACQPGERWYYSYATDVLAYLLQQVLGMTIAEAMQQMLFDPLGMSDTGFCIADSELHRVSDMFGQTELGTVGDPALTDNTLRPMSVEQSYPLQSKRFMRGGIGLYSTLADYRKFMHVLFEGTGFSGEQLLEPQTVDLLWRNHLDDHQLPIAIGAHRFEGYGWGLVGRVLVDASNADVISTNGEGGWSGAASTHFWIDRQNRFSGIVMAQYLGSAVTLGADIQSLAYQAMDKNFTKR